MSCCGSQRQAYAAQPPQRRLLHPAATPNAPATTPATPPHPPVPAATSVPLRTPARFQYRGSRALKLINPATGHHYDFAAPGAVLPADPADAAWLAAVPWLSRLP